MHPGTATTDALRSAPPTQGPAAVASAAPAALTSWPRSAQWAAATLLGGVLVLLAYHALANSGHGARATQLITDDGPIYRLDLNRARAAELMQIPGIGPELAERIVARRRQAGPFQALADLRQVAGIGEKTLARIKPWLCVEIDEPARKDVPAPVKTRRPAVRTPGGDGKKESALAGKLIDVNSADIKQLQRLPRIGPKLAQRIIETRDSKPFAAIDDLRRVKGIGPKTLEGLRPFVTTGDKNPSTRRPAEDQLGGRIKQPALSATH